MMAAPAPFLAPGALAPAGSGTRDPLPRRADHRARLSPRPARGNSGDRRPGRVSIVPRAASDANGAPDDPDPSGATLESEFMRVMREQNARVRQATATRWKQGGLRPRVVHESDSDYIRRVDFQWPNAVMGTASGAVLVSNCEELGGSEYRERARRLVAARRDAHGRDWQAADDRGLGERSLLGLYDGGAITAVAIADDVVASGGRDGYLRAWRLPKDADVDSPSHPSEGLPLELVGEAKHPNVVTSIAMDPTTGTAWTTCLDGCLRRWEYARGAARADSKPGRGGGPIFRLGLGFSRAASSARGGVVHGSARAVRGALRVGTRGVRGHRRWTRLRLRRRCALRRGRSRVVRRPRLGDARRAVPLARAR